ncbi:MAG: hypothetical protein D6814_15590 [Calditrichaeota bacterium]|nr:MAG: hypothetical protein D6814_15590 [Calditrichota bacterium]
MRQVLIWVLALGFVYSGLQAQNRQEPIASTFEAQFLQSLSGLHSNSITDIVVHNGWIWLGTGKGVSLSKDGGQTWQTFTKEDGLGRGSLSAIAVNDTIVWVATAFDSLTKDAGELPTGGGLAYSLDFGQSWTWVPQPGPTPVQNVTFDIALHDDGSVWITSWGGGIQRTFNLGQTWEVVPPDTFFFDPLANLNHRGFAVVSANGVLWVGTAGGINKSLDNGHTWTNFRHQNQVSAISGNFVVALAVQNYHEQQYIWAATVNAEDPDEFRAVSVSDDGGFSWRTVLEGQFAHNFAFDDSVVYVAADGGLFKSIDFGETWAKFPEIEDRAQHITYLSQELFTVAVAPGHTLWVGGPDGLAKTTDDGLTWQIFRGNVRPGENNEPRTYAYPSPFSPQRHNTLAGDGHIRFQYNTTRNTRVTIRVYNFAMEQVAEIVSGKERPANGSFFEVWDGRNPDGDIIANGVYFYSVQLEGEGIFWGKFIVMD